jgi:hypothetical protein
MEPWPQRVVLEPALQLLGFDAPSIDGLKEYDVKKVAIAAANVVKHCSVLHTFPVPAATDAQAANRPGSAPDANPPVVVASRGGLKVLDSRLNVYRNVRDPSIADAKIQALEADRAKLQGRLAAVEQTEALSRGPGGVVPPFRRLCEMVGDDELEHFMRRTSSIRLLQIMLASSHLIRVDGVVPRNVTAVLTEGWQFARPTSNLPGGGVRPGLPSWAAHSDSRFSISDPENWVR